MVAAVTRQTQALLLGFLGAVLLRMSLSDAYLRYVTEWMKWPILASGVLMLLLAIGPLFRDPENTARTTTTSTVIPAYRRRPGC